MNKSNIFNFLFNIHPTTQSHFELNLWETASDIYLVTYLGFEELLNAYLVILKIYCLISIKYYINYTYQY